tara:strand:+ start:2377 stop:2586 length:210 start_codon:yes stop_codon:yes gene_type:complete
MYKSKTNDKKKSETKKLKPRALKKEEVELFKTHSKHHSKKHIQEMKKFIKEGRGCFSESHKHANKKVGK